MKLFMKKDNIEYSLDVGDTIFNRFTAEDSLTLIEKLTTNISKEFFGNDAHNSNSSMIVFDNKIANETKSKPADRDSFSIRQRLPNNVVDLSKLDVKQAVTEAALVRCPECGQSHAIVLMDGDKLYLMRRSYSAGEFGIVCAVSPNDSESMKNIRPNGNTPEDRLNYFFTLQGMGFLEDKDFNVTNDTEVFCPVCGRSSSFFAWKDAYENKEKYFEYQYICGACGSECIMDAKAEKDSSDIVVCTECGHKWIKEQT